MNRRTFVATGTAAVIGSLSGCVTDEIQRNFLGETVPFKSPSEAHSMWEEDEARFVDARGQYAYQQSHITDAFHSPADSGLPENDPVEQWPKDERIITYCTCPFNLAGRRAATLIASGYSNVWGLDKGFQTWIDEYPNAVSYGSQGQPAMPSYAVQGRSDPGHAGEYVWITHPSTGQRELAKISPDGSYEMTLHFYDLSPSSRLRVEAPDYTLEASLEDLTSTTVSPGRL